MRAAVVQLNSQDDVALNLARVRHWIAQAAATGARLVALPENFAFMGEEARKREIAERLDGAFPGPSSARSRRRRPSTASGFSAAGMPERSDDPARPYNTSVLVDPKGAVAADVPQGAPLRREPARRHVATARARRRARAPSP